MKKLCVMELLRDQIRDLRTSFWYFRGTFLFGVFFAAIFPARLVAFYQLTVHNHIMPKQIFRRIETQDWMTCLQECNSDVACSSYNFKYNSSKIGINCELSKCAIGEGIKGRQNDLLFEQGFVFQQIRPTKNESLCAITEESRKAQSSFGGLETSSIFENLSHKYLVDLSNFLNNGLKRRRRWNRCYHGRADKEHIHPWQFHLSCDSKGPTVTIIRVFEYIFGGYFDDSWKSSIRNSCQWLSSTRAFLFSLNNKDQYSPHRFNTTSKGKDTAVYDCLSYGPTFGQGHDLLVSGNNTENESYTRSFSYETPPGCTNDTKNTCTFYTGKLVFTVDEMEVFYESKINS